MKSIKQYINEKLVLNKGTNSTSKDILNIKIKSLEHLKEVLTNYYEAATTYEVKPSRILTKPIKWYPAKFSALTVFDNINVIEVGNHFKIELIHNNKAVYQINFAEYKLSDDETIIIIQQKQKIWGSFRPDDIIGLPTKYSKSLKEPLKVGRNLLDWFNDLKSIKISDGTLPFNNREFLRLLKLYKDE